MSIAFFIFAAILLVMIPFAPQLLRLRVRILRWMRWNWAANVIENHFNFWVLFARIMLVVVAGVLCYFGWADLQN